ncbi:hypothetical protein K8R66_01320 [bacterium]|nr:hypothetical protein [bacterium]
MVEKIELGKTFYSWYFPEFKKYKHSTTWYIVLFVFVASLLLAALLMGNFLFAVIVIMTTIIVLLQNNKEPIDLEVKITEGGIEIGNKVYPYKDISNFFIIYEPPNVSNLYLELKSKLKARISIPLKEQNPVNIRDTLFLFLEEDVDKSEEPASDFLTRVLKL